jgi:hypothetical protein
MKCSIKMMVILGRYMLKGKIERLLGVFNCWRAHLSSLQSMEKYHCNIMSQFIADEMYGVIVDNLAYEPRSMIRHIKEK